jgi:hypothetical protein
MQSPFDASLMKNVRSHVFEDAANGYFIADIPAIRAEFDGKIQQLHTREMKLDTLGVFPLAKTSLPLLEKIIVFEGRKLFVPALFAKSQIPIFAHAGNGPEGSQYAYISAEGASICRYFFELWQQDDVETTELETIVQGFAILASYAGL